MSARPVSEIIGYAVVHFDEPDQHNTGTSRDVARDCKRCLSSHDVYGEGVVSPTGIAHIVASYGDTTLCGKNATGANWWWPL